MKQKKDNSARYNIKVDKWLLLKHDLGFWEGFTWGLLMAYCLCLIFFIWNKWLI